MTDRKHLHIPNLDDSHLVIVVRYLLMRNDLSFLDQCWNDGFWMREETREELCSLLNVPASPAKRPLDSETALLLAMADLPEVIDPFDLLAPEHQHTESGSPSAGSLMPPSFTPRNLARLAPMTEAAIKIAMLTFDDANRDLTPNELIDIQRAIKETYKIPKQPSTTDVLAWRAWAKPTNSNSSDCPQFLIWLFDTAENNKGKEMESSAIASNDKHTTRMTLSQWAEFWGNVHQELIEEDEAFKALREK